MLVKNNEARIMDIAGTQLVPGINDVADDVWGEHKKIALVKGYLDSKMLEEVKSSDAEGQAVNKTGTPSPGDIATYSEGDAVNLVGQTWDKLLLNKWKSAEKRKNVQQAIDGQLAAISPQPNPGTGGAEEKPAAHSSSRKKE